MNEMERRLADALAAEAKSVGPHPYAWEQQRNRRIARKPRTVAPWLAAAAAVAVIALGTTIAVHRGGGTRAASGPPTVATGQLLSSHPSTGAVERVKSCDDVANAKTVSIIGATSAPTTARLFFSGALPPRASLCSQISSDGFNAGSGTVFEGGAVGYYSAMWSEKSYLIGAFTEPTASLTLTDRKTSWKLTITPATAGVKNMGGGWTGYFILAPSPAADVQITAKSVSGQVIGGAELTFDSGFSGAPGSGGPAKSSYSATTAPATVIPTG